MKKMLFLMLFLLVLGAASVTSQVRIGGNGQPNGAAVLDLNATDATNTGTKGLALPRVALSSTTAIPAGMGTPINGLMVYNTATIGDVTPGEYYWQTDRWIHVGSGDVRARNFNGATEVFLLGLSAQDTVEGGYSDDYYRYFALRPGAVDPRAMCLRFTQPYHGWGGWMSNDVNLPTGYLRCYVAPFNGPDTPTPCPDWVQVDGGTLVYTCIAPK